MVISHFVVWYRSILTTARYIIGAVDGMKYTFMGHVRATFVRLREQTGTQFIAPVAAAILAACVRLFGGPRTIDDAYITFRYALHIADGAGFVYNVGQHVLGTTTPLYTLMLAGLFRLTGVSLPWLGLIVAAVADAGSTLLTYLLARRAGAASLAALLAAALFALADPTLFYADSGMETSLFTFLLLLACWRYVDEDDIGWSMAAAAATLTRPEGALLLMILLGDRTFIHYSGARPVLPRRPILVASGILAPWIIWATWFFGQPIPQSVLTKASVAHINPMWLNGARLAEFAATLPLGITLSKVGFLLVLLTSAVVMSHLYRTSSRLLPAYVFAVCVVVGYSLAGLRNLWMYNWYPVPLTPFVCIGIFVGASKLSERLGKSPRRVLLSLVGIATLGAQVLALNLGRDSQHSFLAPRYPWPGYPWREPIYAEIGRLLAQSTGGKAVVAAPEIGTLGYFYPGPILDTDGLVSKDVPAYYPFPSAAYPSADEVPPKLIADARPQYLVVLEVLVRQTLIHDHTFLQHYQLIKVWPSDAYGSHGVLEYERRTVVGTGSSLAPTHGTLP